MASDRFVRHANLMSGLTLVSRMAGLVRDKACSYFIGVDTTWAAFWMGFQFPNLFRRIFGEGALTAVFVPAYTEVLHKEGPEKAGKLANATLTLLVLVLSALTLAGEAVLVPIALSPSVLGPNRMAAAMIAIMLPYCVMVCVVALMGAIATVHEKFTAQSLMPIILSVFMAAAAAMSVLVMSRKYPVEKRVFWVALAVVAAGFVQVLMMAPTLRRSGLSLRPVFGFAKSGLGAVLVPMIPIALGYSAVQINTFMDTQIAWWFSSDGHGGATHFTLLGHVFSVAMQSGAGAKLSVAQRIYLLPVGIFGVAMATAIFPPMAKAAADKNVDELKRLLVTGLGKTLFLSIPESFGMILVAKPLITVVYLGGQVTEADVNRAYWAAIFFCLGIWAFEAQMVITRVFFVLKDTKTPTKVALAMIVLNFGLNLTLIWPLREGGIALSTTIAAIMQSAILLAILRKRLGPLGVKRLMGNVLRELGATLVMAGVGLAIAAIPMPWEGGRLVGVMPRLLTAGVKLPALIVVSAGIYLGLAKLMGMPEVGDVPFVGRFLRARKVAA
ncbi:MAG TPA: murein biosynthesis integral membrane protein MurJ [Phycisphaerae bacterium]|nr:murein biosynthesis integral membrane protein MurJ [Phycisphaerae bacterium]